MSDDDKKIIEQLIADGLIAAEPKEAEGDLEYEVLKESDADFVSLCFYSDGDGLWVVEKNRRDSGTEDVYDGDLDGTDYYIRNELK